MQHFIRQLTGGFWLFLLFSGLTACSSTPNIQAEPALQTQAQTFALQEGRFGHSVVSDGEKLYVFGGSSQYGLTGSIEIIAPATQQTQHLEAKITPRRYFSAVWDGKESIYLIGGISSHEGRPYLQTEVEVFNTRTLKVSRVASHHRATRMNTAVYLHEKIYVFGGEAQKRSVRGNKSFVPWVSVYDINTNTWSELADMPRAQSTKAVVKGNTIYLAGGFNGKRQFDTFYQFTPDTSEWLSLPVMPVATSAHSMAVLHNSLYTFGNYDQLDQTLRYDFGSGQWTTIQLPFKPSRHNDSVTIADTIYVVGGNLSSKDSYLNYVQTFTF